jgi:hypothetical protein
MKAFYGFSRFQKLSMTASLVTLLMYSFSTLHKILYFKVRRLRKYVRLMGHHRRPSHWRNNILILCWPFPLFSKNLALNSPVIFQFIVQHNATLHFFTRMHGTLHNLWLQRYNNMQNKLIDPAVVEFRIWTYRTFRLLRRCVQPSIENQIIQIPEDLKQSAICCLVIQSPNQQTAKPSTDSLLLQFKNKE